MKRKSSASIERAFFCCKQGAPIVHTHISRVQATSQRHISIPPRFLHIHAAQACHCRGGGEEEWRTHAHAHPGVSGVRAHGLAPESDQPSAPVGSILPVNMTCNQGSPIVHTQNGARKNCRNAGISSKCIGRRTRTHPQMGRISRSCVLFLLFARRVRFRHRHSSPRGCHPDDASLVCSRTTCPPAFACRTIMCCLRGTVLCSIVRGQSP